MSEQEVIHGDSLEVLREVPDACIDAVVTDPPAGIGFMGREWDSDKGGRQLWIAWLSSVMAECLRVLKPGGHALVWALPRTSHWTATAIEDAGFEIRDRVSHLFGSGFPKSLDVSKAIDAAAGAVREIVGYDAARARPNRTYEAGAIGNIGGSGKVSDRTDNGATLTAPATDAARQWSGWGTALKPACEDWWLARKPLGGTVAANVTTYGTGALNIDACRIGFADEADEAESKGKNQHGDFGSGPMTNQVFGQFSKNRENYNPPGRWPANVALSHSPECGEICIDGCAVRLLDEQSRKRASRFYYVAKPTTFERDAGLEHLPAASGGEATDRVDGSAGLNSPRAGAGRRGGRRNIHPTVKSIELMRWLCRLVTPPGGVVLDPFAGSGSTGCAAALEGLDCLLIEKEEAYVEIARARIAQQRRVA